MAAVRSKSATLSELRLEDTDARERQIGFAFRLDVKPEQVALARASDIEMELLAGGGELDLQRHAFEAEIRRAAIDRDDLVARPESGLVGR